MDQLDPLNPAALSPMGVPGVGSLEDEFGFNDDFNALSPFADDFSVDGSDGFDSFSFGDEFDIPTPTRAIELEGEDFERFKYRFLNALGAARGNMFVIHDRARRDREIYEQLPKTPAYEGGPDITTPLTANKVDGVIAHIRDAVEQPTIFSFNVMGTGPNAAEAALTAPLREQYLEREIVKSGSREVLASDLPKEAAIVGTGIALFKLGQYAEEPFVQVEIVPIERFFVDRVNTRSLRHVTSFYTYSERRYNLDEQAERGLLDEDALAELSESTQGSAPDKTLEETRDGFNNQVTFAEENTLVNLVRGFMRFRPEGERRSRLFECVVVEGTNTVLALRENPFGRAFDSAPIQLVRIGKRPNHLFGKSVPSRLESAQKIADNSMNTHIALNNLAAAPPVQYRENSPFGRAIRSHNRGIVPGMMIPTLDSPVPNDVQVMDLGNPGLALQDVSIAQQMASQGTYTEEAIGTSADPRKTLGQYQSEAQRGVLRLRSDVGDYAYDAIELGQKYDALVLAFKLAPAGVVETAPGGRLLSLDPVDPKRLGEEIVEAAVSLAQSGKAEPEELMAALESFELTRLTDGRIPFARRDDLRISLRGTKIIADKVAELQTYMSVVGPAMSMIPMAEQDDRVNYFMRSMFQAAGVAGVDKLVPPPPNKFVSDASEWQASLAQYFGLLQHSVRY